MTYSVDEVLREGFLERIVKRFGCRCRCRLLYLRRTFLRAPVPMVHIFVLMALMYLRRTCSICRACRQRLRLGRHGRHRRLHNVTVLPA
jgi:hypothetical protein